MSYLPSSAVAPTASPAFTGVPTAPTAAALTSTTQIATTAFTTAAVGVETTARTTAEALLAPLASPTFTGTPAAPTAAAGTSTTQLATTAFVATSFAPLASPTLTGTPAAPTASAGTNTTQVATTAFVTTAIALNVPTAKSSAYTIASADTVVLATAGAGGFTVTLPVAPVAGRRYGVKKVDGAAGSITVVGSSGNVDGAASFAFSTQWESHDFIFDGTNWFVA